MFGFVQSLAFAFGGPPRHMRMSPSLLIPACRAAVFARLFDARVVAARCAACGVATVSGGGDASARRRCRPVVVAAAGSKALAVRTLSRLSHRRRRPCRRADFVGTSRSASSDRCHGDDASAPQAKPQAAMLPHVRIGRSESAAGAGDRGAPCRQAPRSVPDERGGSTEALWREYRTCRRHSVAAGQVLANNRKISRDVRELLVSFVTRLGQ